MAWQYDIEMPLNYKIFKRIHKAYLFTMTNNNIDSRPASPTLPTRVIGLPKPRASVGLLCSDERGGF